MKILGIDPGLTRCGIAVVDAGTSKRVEFVSVEVARSNAGHPIADRVGAIATSIERVVDHVEPDAIAIERVFAQQNLRTVMGVAHVIGAVMYIGTRKSIEVTMYTPSEVKAGVTGYGSADKLQVQRMVARILGLAELPKPADAADALAIAVCHAWRPAQALAAVAADTAAPLTPAQKIWLDAESRGRRPARTDYSG